MPWVKPCNAEKLTEEIRSLTMEAIEKFASFGYRHADLEWRHVGLFVNERRLQALLFDLARVTFELEDIAKQSMMDSLELMDL